MKSISFKRLLEIRDGDPLSEKESSILKSVRAVYSITNDRLNLAYIGESRDLWYRVFDFWKVDKRHVDGENAPIFRYFEGDYEGTVFNLLDWDCDHKVMEFEWDKWYKDNTSYRIVSFPGYVGNSKGVINLNKGKIIINNGEVQKLIDPDQLEEFEAEGWTRGLSPSSKEKMYKTISDNESTTRAANAFLLVLSRMTNAGLEFNIRNYSKNVHGRLGRHLHRLLRRYNRIMKLDLLNDEQKELLTIIKDYYSIFEDGEYSGLKNLPLHAKNKRYILQNGDETIESDSKHYKSYLRRGWIVIRKENKWRKI